MTHASSAVGQNWVHEAFRLLRTRTYVQIYYYFQDNNEEVSPSEESEVPGTQSTDVLGNAENVAFSAPWTLQWP